jgi:Domain of unknown function (DUF4845)
MKRRPIAARQRGLGLLGLLFIGVVIGFLLLVGMKTFPTAMEFIAIKRAVQKAAVGATSAREVQAAFDRSAAIDDITTITGKDLVITKEGDRTVVAFAYEKRIPLFGPASLLLDYQGSSR